jgi:hypothetical protein
MRDSGYMQFAEALVFVHGPDAEVKAAEQAAFCEKLGEMRTAQIWNHVQFALKFADVKKAA